MAHQTAFASVGLAIDQLLSSLKSGGLAVQTPSASGKTLLEKEGLARMIDHTLLKPDATASDIRKLCEEACAYKFATVCVNSSWIPLAAELLRDSQTQPIAVVGFPLGACLTSAKAFETKEAIHLGAREIDMVLQIGALKDGNHAAVFEDIQQVVAAAGPILVKVILETALLSQEQKVVACALAKAAGAAFVKTSTGFVPGGATVEDISLMRQVVGPTLGVKASGGIRSHTDAIKMIEAGATRFGASASITIVTQTGAAQAGQY